MMTFWSALALLLVLSWLVLTGLWCMARRSAWVTANPRRDDALNGSPLVARAAPITALVGIGLLVFVLLARAWQAGAAMPLDRVGADLARSAWSSAAQSGMQAVTHLGDPASLVFLAAVVGLLLWQRRKHTLLVGWLAALGGNAILNPALKGLYQRARPERDGHGVMADGYSFPSGHSSGAMVAYGMLAFLAWRLLPARWHLPALWLAAALILAIGASRVFLEAHFVSDVLAGYASGGAWLALCIAGCVAWRDTGRNARV